LNIEDLWYRFALSIRSLSIIYLKSCRQHLSS